MSDLEHDIHDASVWLAKALTESGYLADFSLESLRELDRFVEEHTDGHGAVSGPLATDTGPRLWAIGAYTGEVIRRRCGGGTWWTEDDGTTPEIGTELRLSSGTVLWPMARAVARVRQGSEHSLFGYGAVISDG